MISFTKFCQLLDEGKKTPKGLDVSIKNINKFSVKKQQELLNSTVIATEKVDGVKLTLIRTNEAFEPSDPLKSWIVGYKGNIVDLEAFSSIDVKELEGSVGISQYRYVLDHLKTIDADKVPKNTEFFLEFLMRKPTLTRKYETLLKVPMKLLAWSPTKYYVKGKFLRTDSPEFNMDVEPYSKILGIPGPRVLLKGKLNSVKAIEAGIVDEYFKRDFNTIKGELNFTDTENSVESLNKLFTSFNSEMGGKPEGVVFQTEDDELFKIVQADQYDYELRTSIKKSWSEDDYEVESAYWKKLSTLANSIMRKENPTKIVYSMTAEDFNKAGIKHSKKALINLKDDLYAAVKKKVALEESNALVIGRFQPLTLGHVKVINEAFKKGAKNVVIGIVKGAKSSEDKERNPFSVEDQIKMIESSFAGDDRVKYGVISSGVVRQAMTDLPYIFKYFVFGKDRKEYKDQLAKLRDIVPIEVERSDEEISATKVRDALRSGDKKTFESMTPAGMHSMYDELRRKIY